MQNCLLCDKPTEIKYKKHPGYQKPATFDIFHCSRCNTAFSMPRVNSDNIYKIIYEYGPTFPGYNRYWEYFYAVIKEADPFDFLAETEDCYWAIKRAIEQKARDNSETKILDVGCGLGYLTYAIHKSGYNVTGIDISEDSIRNAKNAFGDIYIHADINEYVTEHQNEYDIIVLTEVVEHINDFKNLFINIKKMLNKNGEIIITTPNKSFYPENIIWATDLPPVHCWWLSEESIQNLAKFLDMECKFVDFTEFYKKHPVSSNLSLLENIPITPVVIDKNGKPLWEIKPMGFFEKTIRRLKKALKNPSHLYKKYKYSRKKIMKECGSQGVVLCAIFKQSE